VIHEEPWDFWRFSNYTWPALFNRATGFAVESVGMGEPVAIVPRVCTPDKVFLPDAASGYAAVACLARKVGQARVSWDVELSDVIPDMYPE
jgi:hypothetical protein